MRLIQAVVQGLFAVVAVLFGLLAAAVVAVGALAILLTRRWQSGANAPVTSAPRQGARVKSPRDGDAIEVTATEVR